MNHDYTHCADYNEECPETCFRAEITEDLKKSKYPWPVSFASLKNTECCPLNDEKED